jgi:hypothetical protein
MTLRIGRAFKRAVMDYQNLTGICQMKVELDAIDVEFLHISETCQRVFSP